MRKMPRQIMFLNLCLSSWSILKLLVARSLYIVNARHVHQFDTQRVCRRNVLFGCFKRTISPPRPPPPYPPPPRRHRHCPIVVWIIQFLLSTMIFVHYNTSFMLKAPSSIPSSAQMKTCLLIWSVTFTNHIYLSFILTDTFRGKFVKLERSLKR